MPNPLAAIASPICFFPTLTASNPINARVEGRLSPFCDLGDFLFRFLRSAASAPIQKSMRVTITAINPRIAAHGRAWPPVQEPSSAAIVAEEPRFFHGGRGVRCIQDRRAVYGRSHAALGAGEPERQSRRPYQQKFTHLMISLACPTMFKLVYASRPTLASLFRPTSSFAHRGQAGANERRMAAAKK